MKTGETSSTTNSLAADSEAASKSTLATVQDEKQVPTSLNTEKDGDEIRTVFQDPSNLM